MSKEEEVPVYIDGIDGIKSFALILQHGITELWGGNGAMKSRAQAVLAETLGNQRRVSISVTEGGDNFLGMAEVNGRLLEVSKTGSVVRKGTGVFPISLIDPGPVSRLIDPGIKGDTDASQRALREAQLRALLELVPLIATEERLVAVTKGDAEVLSWLEGEIRAKDLADMLAITKSMRLKVQEMARDAEAASEAEDEALTKLSGGLEELEAEALQASDMSAEQVRAALREAPLPVEVLEADRGAAVEERVRVSTRREEYLAEVLRRAELRRSVGERPELSAYQDAAIEAKSEHELAQGDLDDAKIHYARVEVNKDVEARVELAKRQIQATLSEWQAAAQRVVADIASGVDSWPAAGFREIVEAERAASAALLSAYQESKEPRKRMLEWAEARAAALTRRSASVVAEALASRRLEEARRALEAAQERQAQWDETNALLHRDLTGPSEEEVEIATSIADEAEARLRRGRVHVRYQSMLAEREQRQRAKVKKDARAAELRSIEKSAWQELGALVTQETRVPEITLYNGYVAYRTEDGHVHDWNSKFVSEGMRSGAAFRLGARCFGKNSIVCLAGKIWQTLDLGAKLALERVAKEEEVFGLTEVPSIPRDSLHAVHFGSPAWAEEYAKLAAAAAEIVSGGEEA